MVLKVREVGNSLGVLLPAEVTQKLRVGPGDRIFVTETPGGFELSAYDPDFAETMGVAENVMRRYRNTLRELGK